MNLPKTMLILSMLCVGGSFSATQAPQSKIKQLDLLVESTMSNTVRIHVTMMDNNEYHYTTYLQNSGLPGLTFNVVYSQLLFAWTNDKNVTLFYDIFNTPAVPSQWNGIKQITRVVLDN